MEMNRGSRIGFIVNSLITFLHAAMALLIVRLATEETWDGSNGFSIFLLLVGGGGVFLLQTIISIGLFFANRFSGGKNIVRLQIPTIFSVLIIFLLFVSRFVKYL